MLDISMKTFAVLNDGLQSLNLGWTSVSNETVSVEDLIKEPDLQVSCNVINFKG